jgi:hypothetical protein
MLLAVLSVCSPEELEDGSWSEEEEEPEHAYAESADHAARREQIKNKIRAVGRMQLIFQNLRYGTCILWMNLC